MLVPEESNQSLLNALELVRWIENAKSIAIIRIVFVVGRFNIIFVFNQLFATNKYHPRHRY